MNKKSFVITFLLIACSDVSRAQELNARVSVIASRVNSTVDKKVFTTLQTSLNNFINNRKWSNDTYNPAEKIDCSFLFNLESTGDANVYKASLTIQSGRPIFNSAYISPVINFKDDNLLFKYVEFQQLEFNENRVTGSDALESNLTATVAYYIDLILGLDYDSFSLKGGDPYFQKAQNIINNSPEGRGIVGWKAFDGVRNRYWIIENLLNSRYNIIHDGYYNYYRMGLDQMYENESMARTQVINVLSLLNNYNVENPNTMILEFFFQGKSQELIKIFAKAPPQDKLRALEFLQKLDVSNANKYKEALK
ncbi:MAG: DUF4835 family protein [Ginsengibacter sp.]